MAVLTFVGALIGAGAAGWADLRGQQLGERGRAASVDVAVRPGDSRDDEEEAHQR